MSNHLKEDKNTAKGGSGGVGGSFVMGIIVAIITVAVGSSVGLALIGKTDAISQSLGMGVNATAAFNNTLGTIYSVWPLLGLIVLALIGAGVLIAIGIFR